MRTYRLALGWLLSTCVLVLAVVAPLTARAQTEIGSGGATSGSSEIDLRVLQFGLGNVARPGAWTGVQVQVQELGVKSREIVLRLGVRDEDGDTAQYQTTIATTPGSKTIVWLYARLTSRASAQTTYVLSAHEAREGSAAEIAAGVSRAGPQLARVAFQTGSGRMADPESGMMAVIGRSPAGLDQYTFPVSQVSSFPAQTHERIQLTTGLTASSLPDRWMGLSSLDTLVWAASGPDAEPTDLAEQQARAIREWVQRGGHLVVILPPVGQAWTSPGQPLADITPRVTVERDEAADLNQFRSLLNHNAKASLPNKTLVQSFGLVPGARPEEAMRIMAGPDGRIVAVRRLVGSGAVSLVGIDVASRALASTGGVQAEAFWNRLLGRRGNTPSLEEIDKLSKKSAGAFSRREQIRIDTAIGSSISRTGRAAIGVLLAFLIFALYWVIAGPLGFYILKKREQSQYAWLGFVLVGAVFTALAWVGAQSLRPNKTSVQHLTILDAVAGQGTQHARMFVSASLPSYGEQMFGIAGAGENSGTLTNAVAAWEPPPSVDGDSGSTFPDARDYAVASRQPDRVRVPSRSTVKSLSVDWLGGAVYKMPLAVAPDTVPGTPGVSQPLTLSNATPATSSIVGALQHDLPGTLTNVTVIVVEGQSPTRADYSGSLQASTWVREWAAWKPGEVLVLDQAGDATAATSGATSDRDGKWILGGTYIQRIMPRGTIGAFGGQSRPISSTVENDLRLLSLLTILEPPDTTTGGGTEPVQLVRREGHALNMGRWFTQPCVIVTGWLDDVPSPVSLAVDGSAVSTSGRVFVRWVYPLPDNPVTAMRPQ